MNHYNMEAALKYFRGLILVVLLLVGSTCSYGQAPVAHVKAIPPPVNRNISDNRSSINGVDTVNNGVTNNSIHGGTAPVALKRVATNNSHPIRIPVAPKVSATPADSVRIKKDEDR